MPAKSKAELRYLFAAERRGDVKPGVAEEMARATPRISALPEHVHKQHAKHARRAGKPHGRSR